MKPYHNPESGIEAFDYSNGNDWIHVRYKGGKTYEYRSPPLASHHIAKMKELAESGDELNTYINNNRDVHDAGQLIS